MSERRPRLLGLAFIVAACGADPTPPGAEATATATHDRRARAEQAARIAKEILEHPEEGSRVLDEHDLSPDQFSDLMYEIAGDPELAEVYDTVRG